MSEILSQNEIEKLLSNLSNGDNENDNLINNENKKQPKIRKYDFRLANKLTKDQIRTLQNIYGNFSQLLSSYLSGTLMTLCQVDVISVVEKTYLEYTNSIKSPVVLAIIDMAPLDGLTLLEMSSNVAYGIIGRLLGGKNSILEDSKNFTDIDIPLLQKVILHMIKLVNESWGRVIEIDAILDRIETNAQFAQIVAYNEATVIITIKVKIGKEIEGFMNFCIPLIVLEPIAKKMDKSMWTSSKKVIPNAENSKKIKSKLANNKFSIIMKFKDISMPLNDIVNLQPGDVLRLDHNVNEKIQMNIENIPKFYGKLGAHKNRYAVKITDIIKDETGGIE